MRRAVAWRVWAALALLAGCERTPPRLDVRIGSELAWGLGERVQSVSLLLRRGGEGGMWSRVHTAGLGVGPEGEAVDFSVGVLGTREEAGAPVWVEALGCSGPDGCTAATALVAQRAVGRVPRGSERATLSLRLMALCVGISCARDQRCSARGGCEPVASAVRASESVEAAVAGGAPWCPADMRLVPAGMFQMGSASADDPSARPLHGVRLGAFCLDEAAVTVAAYGACVASRVCAAPGTGSQCNWDVPGRERHPVDCVDWEQARAFCRRRGRDLPTESQWEHAARVDPPTGRVAEWTLDWFAPYGGTADSYALDPLGPMDGRERVYRGAPWRGAASVSHRDSGPPTMRREGVGFRCARAPF
jgi:hypothetical protein